MKQVQLKDSDIIEIRNPRSVGIKTHLARVWMVPSVPHCVAWLAPGLAHNLGLALHVLELIEAGLNAHDVQIAKAHRQVEIRRCQTDVGTEAKITKGNTDKPNGNEKHNINENAIHIGGGVSAPIASRIKIKIVREPIMNVLGREPKARDVDDDAEKEHTGIPYETNSDINGIEDVVKDSNQKKSRSDDIVEAIRSFFMKGMRVVSTGDILATTLPARNGARVLLGNLGLKDDESELPPCSEDHANDLFSRDPLYFRVEQVVPTNEHFCAVDIENTLVEVTGTCACGLPVGARNYLTNFSNSESCCFVGLDRGSLCLKVQPCLRFVGKLLSRWSDIATIIAPALHPAIRNLSWKISLLLHGPQGSGKKTAISAAAAALGCHAIWISCSDIRNNSSEGKAGDTFRAIFDAASEYRPCLLVLDKVDQVATSRNSSDSTSIGSFSSHIGSVLAECISKYFPPDNLQAEDALTLNPVIVIGCTNDVDLISPPIRRCFTHEIAISPPDKQEREFLLRSWMENAGPALKDEDWESLARHTAGLLPRDLRGLAADACAAASLGVFSPESILRSASIDSEKKTCSLGTGPGDAPPQSVTVDDSQIALQQHHIESAVEIARERTVTDIGAPKIPDVRWEDIGGLFNVKAAILDTVELPLRHPELFASGLRRRSGVLLYGPPGTGKTLIAKAVATECSINFLSVKGPELINMYVGESERLIRDVFARARRARPCVIFFDELDSLAPARGKGSDSGGIMDRVVSQLLAEIDSAQGGSGTDDVFIIGATNRPDLLDPALLRPGRIDKLLYVGIAADIETRVDVLRALTRKFDLAEDVNLESIAHGLPACLTGADLYALCSDAWMLALKGILTQSASDNDMQKGRSRANIVVYQQDFLNAASMLRPSLSEREVLEYEAIRDQYERGRR